MQYRELFKSCLVEIRANKFRSALSAVSISIGVGAIVYTFAQIAGMQQRFRKAVELAGPGRLDLQPKENYISRGLSRGFNSKDAEEIRRLWPEIYMVYPLVRRWGARMTYGGFRGKNLMIVGTTPDWRLRDWVYKLNGRFLNDRDLKTSARVCVLIEPGGWIKKPYWAKYFPEQATEKIIKHKDLIGRNIQIEDHAFTVVGILLEPPRDRDPRWFKSGYGAIDGTAIVPITTYRQLLVPSYKKETPEYISEIQIDTGQESTAGLYKHRIEELLNARHRGEKDYELKDFKEIVLGALKRLRASAIAVLVIGVVAILAGGIGIMNVTLAVTFSRIREIGIRRALGATRRDIVAQFAAEATLLGVFGGAAGLPLGIAAVQYLAPDPERIVMPGLGQMGLALFIAVATAFLFSLYPAYRASRFDPLEALHYE